MSLFKYYLENSLEKLAEAFLSKNKFGELKVSFPSGKIHKYKAEFKGYKADIKFNNYRLFYKLMKKGSIGFAESYMDGDFESTDLSDLLLFWLKFII